VRNEEKDAVILKLVKDRAAAKQDGGTVLIPSKIGDMVTAYSSNLNKIREYEDTARAAELVL
jgi:hypothetical protein